jgi:cyanate permease
MAFGIGSSLGRMLGGFVFDMAGSYTPALIGAAAVLVVAVALVNRLGAYAYPVHREAAPRLAAEPAT